MEYKIIASNLPNPKKVTLSRLLRVYLLLENNVFSRNVDYKIQENISAIALINQKNQSSFLGKVGWGILGNALFGGIGAAAGVLCGGNETALICAIEVYPSWKLVASLDEEAYKDLKALAKKNASLGKVLADSDLIKVKEDFIPTRNPAPKFSPGAGIITPPPQNAPTDKTGTPVPEPAAPEVKKLTLDDLPKLKNLLDAGIITQEEFAAAKKKALGL